MHLMPLAATLIGAVSAPSLAQTPSDIADLVGARGAGGETQMEARGWVHIKTDKGDDRAWSNWWHPARRQCVSVVVMNGRFDTITSTPPPDCNQRTGAPMYRDTVRPDNEGAQTASPARLNDLWTMLAPNADIQLQNRGFRTVRAYQAGDTAYTIRSNATTGQCVQVAVEDGRVRYISPLKANACR